MKNKLLAMYFKVSNMNISVESVEIHWIAGF